MPKDNRRLDNKLESLKKVAKEMETQRREAAEALADLEKSVAGLKKVNHEQLERILAYGRKLHLAKGILASNQTPEQKVKDLQHLVADWN